MRAGVCENKILPGTSHSAASKIKRIYLPRDKLHLSCMISSFLITSFEKDQCYIVMIVKLQ